MAQFVKLFPADPVLVIAINVAFWGPLEWVFTQQVFTLVARGMTVVFGVFMVLRELGLHIVHRFKMEDWTGANGTAAVLVCLGLSPAGIVDRVLLQDLSLGF